MCGLVNKKGNSHLGKTLNLNYVLTKPFLFSCFAFMLYAFRSSSNASQLNLLKKLV